MTASMQLRREWTPYIRKRYALVAVLPAVILLGVFVLYPLVLLFVESSADGFEAYGRILSSGSGRKAIFTTFTASLIVTALVLVVGSLIAWTIRTTTRAGVRGLCWACVLIPFWMGTIVKNYAIILLISKEGVVNTALGWFGHKPVQLMYTTPAVVLGISYSLVPFAVLTVHAVFQTIDVNLLRNAEVLGSTRSGALLRVMVPLATPGLIASGAVVFALAVGFYVTPVTLGGAQAPFLAGLIQTNILEYFDYPAAAALAMILLGVALLMMIVTIGLVGPGSIRKAITRS
ncbi:ABC transporter permease [Amycolatopsis pithecellobii]|uniref:ABC transporter permease subunit n=1 Tax=Amycolatopsis pithecellobii TaxID=664692 RepID=A0A6N7Z0E2_9PSEU|nr:ABC transporter permease [Amycolatopsis pithecellobii]MTD53221.1 ABC transporter permease subunit [Amycolatopsis pithecellobii]